MTSAANKLFSVYGGPTLDPAVAAFAAASGATDLTGLNALIRYVRAKELMANFRIYPMKSAQNAGSGSTVYGIGDLTSNNMSLVASPTWGVSGVAFDGTTQRGTIADFLGADTVTQFCRLTHSALPAGTAAVAGQYDTVGDQRSFALFLRGSDAGDPYGLNRSTDGTAIELEAYVDAGGNYATTDRTLVSQWVHGGGRSFWIDKSSESLSLSAGFERTTRLNSTADITISGLPGGNHMPCVFTAYVIVTGSLTEPQRETITDLINAL